MTRAPELLATRYLVEVHAGFEAAHHLLSYRGAVEPTHGHSWKVSIAIAAAELDSEGMAFDFVAARRVLLDLTALFDHRDINSVPPFDSVSPTTERLAEWFCGRMQERLPAATVRSATVWEGPNCSATYFSPAAVAR
jgi:6-pyruvoyltetrahydropterin/6-carboxytetrahydropterin synthase